MPARLDISLKNLKYNVDNFKSKLLENQELLVMVKADAYGSGIVETTKFLESNGVSHFGVAYLKEAIALRESGVSSEIIVFSGLIPEEYAVAVNVDAIYSVSNINTLEELNNEAKKAGKIVKVELAIDTGMTRLGFDRTEIHSLACDLNKFSNIEVHGVYSHFSQADTSEDFTQRQIKVFDECIETLKANGINSKYVHLCNSAGILRYNSEKYNLVRLGIGTYGYPPDVSMKQDIALKGIFKLTAPVCNIRRVGAGREVSYGGTHVTNKPTKIAVLQIGYADGLTRTLSNRYEVLINGKYARIIGNICMDTCMIDITDIDVNVGDEAVIFDYTDDRIQTIADITDTIVYEVITNIGKRVDRCYINE
ncbi:MAG: alanine racemase [Clostridia bacterium]|nr:alanine racemase [Clostridia bacterium]